MTPNRLWVGLFAAWLMLLSGSLRFWKSSPPGAIQALSLHSLKKARSEQLTQIERQIERLQSDAIRLTQNRVAQEREVRKVLGYAGEDELLFDFSTGSRVVESANEFLGDSNENRAQNDTTGDDQVSSSLAAPASLPKSQSRRKH